MSVDFQINGKAAKANAETDTPLLWVIRDELGLTGTKFGCGAALCGACTVHVDGQPTRSCQTPISSVAGKKVATVEGLSNNASFCIETRCDDSSDARPAAAASPPFPAARTASFRSTSRWSTSCAMPVGTHQRSVRTRSAS